MSRCRSRFGDGSRRETPGRVRYGSRNHSDHSCPVDGALCQLRPIGDGEVAGDAAYRLAVHGQPEGDLLGSSERGEVCRASCAVGSRDGAGHGKSADGQDEHQPDDAHRDDGDVAIFRPSPGSPDSQQVSHHALRGVARREIVLQLA